MAKEYILNNKTYLFSKAKFQLAVKNRIKKQRSSTGERYTNSDFYCDLGNGIDVSEETVRKWYSLGGSSPVDINMVEAISEFLGLDNVNELLDEKKTESMCSQPIEVNLERDFIKKIYQDIIEFAKKYTYGEFDGNGDFNVTEKNIMNNLQQLHLEIDKLAFDLRSETIKKLHDIILTYTEDLMTSDISSKWDALCSEDYRLVRDLYRSGYDYNQPDGSDYDSYAREYVKKIFPYVYEDDDSYYYIPFTTEFFYLSEFTKSLGNVFRNDFPELFIFE